MSLLDSAKNFAAAKALRPFLERHLEPYAELTEVSVDVAGRAAVITLLPRGPEERSVTLRLGYEVVPGERPLLRVVQADCGRPWAQALAREFLVSRSFELPRAAGVLLA